MESDLFVTKINQLHALHDHVIVSDMNFAERQTRAGIVIAGDDAKDRGIRPRWGRVIAIGPKQESVQVGQWICVAHGRWTRGVKVDMGQGPMTIRRVDNNDILLVSDHEPMDETVSDLG
jgi:co-chaperonin GroES (HSP10)